MNHTTFMAATASGLLLAAGTAAPASAATTIEGSVSGISYHDADPGLVLSASALAFTSFTLDPGESFVVDVLNVATGEGSVNWGEDTDAYPISVAFDFTNPAGASGSPVSGSSYGVIIPLTPCGFLAGGCARVNWGSPSIFTFGNGGQFSLALSDVTFRTPGNANVSARFTLISDSMPAVPEPSTWAMLLLGFGAVGAGLRSRRRQTVVPSYA